MKLTILNVAYPAAPVGGDAVGGAEQVLTQLDRALVGEGHDSLVIACEGSQAAGILLPTRRPEGILNPSRFGAIHESHRNTIEQALQHWPVDLIHMHGIDFFHYLPCSSYVPVLATLHLPPEWYPPEVFRCRPSNVYIHCVSEAQRRACPCDAGLLETIPNGVRSEEFIATSTMRRGVLSLGRICPEKGFHLALGAAKRAGVPMLLAGEVFRYPAHMEYFDREIAPRLDQERRFIGPVGFSMKRELLASAECLLVPSLASETSSLVAMEALASGTPVIAFPAGALPEIIDHGRTGFIVQDEAEMADAIHAVRQLDPEDCRRVARERYSLNRTIHSYLCLYRQLAEEGGMWKPEPEMVHVA